MLRYNIIIENPFYLILIMKDSHVEVAYEQQLLSKHGLFMNPKQVAVKYAKFKVERSRTNGYNFRSKFLFSSELIKDRSILFVSGEK